MPTTAQLIFSALCRAPYWLGKLADCIWHLGPRNGLRYWRIMRACEKDPELVRGWAFQCRVEANEAEFAGDPKAATALRDWAGKLEACYAANVAKN